MKPFLLVALGGGAGAVCRYALTLLPISSRFPFATLIANALGALIIGFLAGCAIQLDSFPANLNLLLKTGFCGGFAPRPLLFVTARTTAMTRNRITIN